MDLINTLFDQSALNALLDGSLWAGCLRNVLDGGYAGTGFWINICDQKLCEDTKHCTIIVYLFLCVIGLFLRYRWQQWSAEAELKSPPAAAQAPKPASPKAKETDDWVKID